MSLERNILSISVIIPATYFTIVKLYVIHCRGFLAQFYHNHSAEGCHVKRKHANTERFLLVISMPVVDVSRTRRQVFVWRTPKIRT